MRTRESLEKEIQVLMQEMAKNGMRLRMAMRTHNVREQLELMTLRTELFKSICHRQGLLIEVLKNDVRFGKEAA